MTYLQKLVYGDPISATWGVENRAKLDLWRWHSPNVNSLEDINEHYSLERMEILGKNSPDQNKIYNILSGKPHAFCFDTLMYITNDLPREQKHLIHTLLVNMHEWLHSSLWLWLLIYAISADSKEFPHGWLITFCIPILVWIINTYACHKCNAGCTNAWSSLKWRHNRRDGVSNHQPHECLLNRLFRRR